MEPCHFVSVRVPSSFRSPAKQCVVSARAYNSTEGTLKHLISIIEQLKSKDRVISQLERELGHPTVVAGPISMATEVTRISSPGQHSNKMETPPSSPHEILSGLSKMYQRLHGTTLSSFPEGGEEKGVVEGFAGLEAEIMGLHDRAEALALDRQSLLDKVRDFENKNKQLVEKNKRFLEKNIELTALNRNLKDGNQLLQQRHKKMQEDADEARQRLCNLARELQREKGHSLELEDQVQCVEQLKKQLSEQDTSITALRQACSEKDRRIELIQHRKKRRRLIRSQEKCSGVKETFYGYDEDENDQSVDSENSFSLSSVSVSTLSEEDGCDELSREDLERSHRQMLREHLQLERSHALLQAHAGSSQDPHRELQMRSQLQADLFSAQCRIELLEKEIRSLQRGKGGAGSDCGVDVQALMQEREDLMAAKESLALKLQQVDGECERLRQDLRTALERAEDLEFSILELEEGRAGVEDDMTPEESEMAENGRHSSELEEDHGGGKVRESDGEGNGEDGQVTECLKKPEEQLSLQLPSRCSTCCAQLPALDGTVSMEVERLRRELTAALKGRGLEADAVLKRLEDLKDAEDKVLALERMARELQSKVITLQQERDGLQEQLLRGAPVSVVAEVERRQNLELKEEITRLMQVEEDLRSKNLQLMCQLDDSEKQCLALKKQIETTWKPGCGGNPSIIPCESSSREDLTDEEKIIQNGKVICMKEDKITQTEMDKSLNRTNSGKGRSGKSSSWKEDHGNHKSKSEQEKLVKKVENLEKQLQKLQEENAALSEKLASKSPDSSSDEEDSLHRVPEKPKAKIKSLERQLQVLHSENMHLADRLTGHFPTSRQDRDDVVQRIIELEDFSNDLQDRVRAAEAHDRQTREKLRLAEQTINELESSEAQYRDRCDELTRLEKETKKQLHALQMTGRELREIILDKDVMEQALREKVDFLEKVEAQSTQRIHELEAAERSLREQLDSRDSNAGGSDSRLQALQEKLAASERENRTLNDRINELEENEEILRENWRRVADEDANRTQTLEQKVRMLELLNRDLKHKLTEAQDQVIINTVPSQGSLAEELSATKMTTAKMHSSRPLSPGASDEDSGEEESRKSVAQLKRQLSFLEEEKNSKIAGLQEKLAQLRENEIKLSETLAEMEMTERELRAKLALYESSEVTVEKMLKYQDRIKELRSSQESLLDQLETMETQELSLQERMEEMERRLKGKIVSLEGEMKGLKQKELKGAARIRELEKQETELMEKLAKQEEKENGLYVRISSLMDQLKDFKGRVVELETEVAEKEKRCARVASLETKLHQIEEAYQEKMVTLENSLAEKEEQMTCDQEQHAETSKSQTEKITSLEEDLQSKEKEHNQRVFILEEMFAQKEKGLSSRISSLEKDLSEKCKIVSSLESEAADRDCRIADLEKDLSEQHTNISHLKMELSNKDSEISSLESQLAEKDGEASEQLEQLRKELADKESLTVQMEERLIEMSTEMSHLQTEAAERDAITHQLKSELTDKELECSEHVSQLRSEMEDKDRLAEERLTFMENELELAKHEVTRHKDADFAHSHEISTLRMDLEEKISVVSALQERVDRAETEVSLLQIQLTDKNTSFEAELREKEQKFESQLHSRDLEMKQSVSDIEKECESLQGELTEKDLVIEKLESTKNDLLSKVETMKDREQELLQAITSLEMEIEDLQSQKEAEVRDVTSSLQSRLLEAEVEREKVQQKLSSTEEQLLGSSQNVDEQAARVSQLEFQLLQAQGEADVLRQKLSELEDQERESSSRVDSLLQQETILKAKMSQVESQLEASARSQDQQSASVTELSLCKHDLESALSRLESELSQSQAENTMLQERVSALSEQTEALKMEVSDLKAECDRCQSLEIRLREKLDKERSNGRELEEQIGKLKQEKQSGLNHISELKSEVDHLQQTIKTLEEQILVLQQCEEKLKLQVEAEQESNSELNREFAKGKDRVSELELLLEETKTQDTSKSSKIDQLEATNSDLLNKVKSLERTVFEKSDELEREKSDVLWKSEQLEAAAGAAKKEKELSVLLTSSQEREKMLVERISSLEMQVAKHQEDHSQGCLKLQHLEKREVELLEQMTDIEQTVIIPLETENTELKEELATIKQQNAALNLQLDKQEERAGEDSEEIEGLTKSLKQAQLSQTELKSKLDIVSEEVNKLELENENLKEELIEADTVNKSLEEQLDNNRAELREMETCDKEAQTEGDWEVASPQLQALQNKLIVLEDAEGRFMSRIVDLEEREQQLNQELESARLTAQEKELCDRQTETVDLVFDLTPVDETQSSTDVSSQPSLSDAATHTDDLQEQSTAKVSELFARVQELEMINQRLSTSLELASTAETDRKQLVEKIQLLEQAEDKLMERVMEMEESEVMLRTQMERSRKRAEIADELEEEVSVLLHQEDEWKEKVEAFSKENSALSEKLATLETQFSDEQSKTKSLSDKLEADQQYTNEVQKELKTAQSKLLEIRTEYEGKLSAFEESEKQVKNQLSSQSQHECELEKEVQVLREDMNDVCERYKELEHENSQLKQEHSKVLSKLKDAESRCLELGSGLSEPTVQAVKTESRLFMVPQGGNLSRPADSRTGQQPPQMCSDVSVQLVQSSPPVSVLRDSQEESLLARISQLEKELSSLKQSGSGAHTDSRSDETAVISSGTEKLCVELRQPDSSGAQRPVSPMRILSLHDALQENSSLRTQIQDLQTRLASQSASKTHPPLSTDTFGSRSVETLQAEISRLQAEVAGLQVQVQELESGLAGAEETMQDVQAVFRTRSVHTLQQKIQTIRRTVRTQRGPTMSLQQQLLELLTSQAELQEEVVRLTESQQSLRSSLKAAEEEVNKVKASSGGAQVPTVRRLEAERRISVPARLRLGAPNPLSLRTRAGSDREAENRAASAGHRERQEWLERQVTDLQFSKSSLERRLHEAERRLAFRPRSTNASRDELQFRLEQLQSEQTELKKKVADLEALNSHYLKEKVELAQEKEALEQRIKESSRPARKELSIAFVREEPLGSSGTGSEGESECPNMLEKPEDVLQNRIKELEHLEKHLRQQLNEVESDREQLHEIARKDKAMIHEQNVRLRELMLQERNLRAQVTGLEDSERSLYNRCGELEDTVARLEDRVHELEVHERRLRELVRKLKLDEEVWLNKSGDLTSSMEQLSASEGSLRKLVQDLQIEKGGLADRAEYLEARVKELENLETTMMQRLKNYENVEASLQSRLQHIENSEAAAYSKASELDMINMDLSARLQRAVEENAVLSQHVAQQQGQIHELDRKLSTAMDAEVSLSQHVDSVQKNESSLQKKVREYELRDIDAQARIRELEQTEEIMKDKVNQLQRSENRLKARLVEFESVGGQVVETLPPAQKQQLPQKLEECQKRVVFLQRQLETAQTQLQHSHASKEEKEEQEEQEEEGRVVKVPEAAFQEMRARVALLEETEQQMEELEKLNKQLNDNIVLLRQGKGSCGHEVEIEVLRRRVHSYQNFNQKLKHHLSEGQVPSLWAADPGEGQGPESEDLPARSLQALESERVLHTVRGLTQPHGSPHKQDSLLQAESSSQLGGRPESVAVTSSVPEESHWRTIELRQRAQHGPAEQRGASARAAVTTAATMPHASANTALAAQEEMMIGLTLPSESERSFKSQNDTDSELSGTPRGLRVAGVTQQSRLTPTSVGGEAGSPPMPPHPARPPPPSSQQQHTGGFTTDDSFYLPSSAQEGSDSLEEDEAPPLPSSAPPGPSASTPAPPAGSDSPRSRTFVSKVTMPGVSANSGGAAGTQARSGGAGMGDGAQKGKLHTSAVGISIRQRIAQIERQLQELPGSRASSRAADDDVFTWKARAAESSRLQGLADRENKQLKDDLPPAARRREKINRLEKDIEEKRRYFDIFEKWIVDAEEVLKNKNKKNDRDIVQQLQTEMKHLKQDLGNAGYRKDDIYSDPAALKTELDRRDRELSAKRTEMEGLMEELHTWRSECGNIEIMRRNALDSLRCLEAEVAQLQDADTQLKQMKDEYNTLRGQYDELDVQRNKAVMAVHALRAKVARLAKKCQEKDELLRRLVEESRGGRGCSSSLLEELTRLEAQAGGEEYNRPLSPLDLVIGPVLSDTDRLLAERIPQSSFTRWPSSSSLGDPRDLGSDTELRRSGGPRPSLQRPRSADETSQRRGHHSSVTVSHSAPMSSVAGTLCVAIVDYVPDGASRSGHPHLELALKEGDQVRVRGPVDRHGYCEAEVGGRIGLVPASHLYPLTDGAATCRTSPHHPPHSQYKGVGGDSPEQIVQMFDELQDARLLSASASSHPHPAVHSSTTQTQQPRQRRSMAKNHGPPESPSNLRVEDVDGSGLVLAWKPPALDQHGCSNGSKVVGYRIYLNGRVCQQPHSPRLSHIRVEGVRHDRPQHLAIQTLAASGQVSARVELAYQGLTSSPSLGQNGASGEVGDTDLSSILNSIHYKTGKKKTVMGLYDYDPEKQSPGDYTACELAFHAGDIMFVYGDERTDGFYHGERNGQRGLIPACFVEPVQPKPRSAQKINSANGQTSPRS